MTLLTNLTDKGSQKKREEKKGNKWREIQGKHKMETAETAHNSAPVTEKQIYQIYQNTVKIM